MKNYILYILKSKLNLNVCGNNIERFIKRLKNNDIEILNIVKISDNEVNIKIYKTDYENVIKLKTIYEINILDYYGTVKLKNNIIFNKFIIILILLSLVCLYTITSIVFDIDVITNDSKMENILIGELKTLGIKKYSFKKNYNELQNIKKTILSKYRNELDWIEIEAIGTKYIVRFEPRVTNDIENQTPLRNIIATKSAIIRDLNISSGQIIKDVNSYVNKGEVIVSGYIKLNDGIKDSVSSKGSVYGEVWYNVEITYPYKYYEEHETGKKNNVFVVQFLNKKIELFNFHKYKTKKTKDKVLLKNVILPIKFLYQTQMETKVKNENNTDKDVINKAISYSKLKINEKLKKGEYIDNYKVLNKKTNKDSITLNIFFSVIEDITGYEEISKFNPNIENEDN